MIFMLIWIFVGIIVTRYLEHGLCAMIAHNHQWLGLFMLFACWLLWPFLILFAVKERLDQSS